MLKAVSNLRKTKKQSRAKYFCKTLCFLLALLSSPLLGSDFNAKAESTDKILHFATAIEEPITMDRIVTHAFRNMDIEITINQMGMRTAVAGANSGRYDGICSQSPTVEAANPELVRVPVEIATVKYLAYTLNDNAIKLETWDDFRDLLVGTFIEKPYFSARLKEARAAQIEKANWNELLDALDNNECDVILVSSSLDGDLVVPKNFRIAGVIETQPRYIYLNKKNAGLIPELTQSLADMRADGSMSKIRNFQSVTESDVKSVLYISSFSSEMIWEQQIAKGVSSVFDPDYKIQYYTVNLNSRRILNKESRDQVALNTICVDFASKIPDAVIVSDNEALEFVTNYYNVLFNNVPIVFCSISNYSEPMLRGIDRNITGFVKGYSAFDTVDVMLELFPGTKKIFVIVDYSASGLTDRSSISKQLEPFEDKIEIIYNENVPIDKLYSTVATLEEHTVILSAAYYVDSEGYYLSTPELQTRLYEAAKVPIFGVWGGSIGYGQIGGRYNDPFYQGRQAAETVKKIIAAGNADGLPEFTDTTEKNQWIFDYNELNRFNIKINKLPPDLK